MNTDSYIFFTEIPHGIIPKREVAGCFCFYGDKFLLLKRHEDKPQGGTWCLPAGKKENQESPIETAIREVFEETGLQLKAAELKKVGSYYIQMPHVDFVFHTFAHKLSSIPSLTIDTSEHVEHRWINFTELDEVNLIAAGREVLDFCQPHLT